MEENRYMAKMRVHELAKELNIKSQDVIDTLNGTQFAVKNVQSGQGLAMTVLENCVWKIRLSLSMPVQRDWSIGKSSVSI